MGGRGEVGGGGGVVVQILARNGGKPGMEGWFCNCGDWSCLKLFQIKKITLTFTD